MNALRLATFLLLGGACLNGQTAGMEPHAHKELLKTRFRPTADGADEANILLPRKTTPCTSPMTRLYLHLEGVDLSF